MATFNLEPIGYFQSAQSDKYAVPRQSNLMDDNTGIIQLNAHCQFEQALEGLEGFERIWVVFRFHRHAHWKPKVLPPRGGKKQGVFATRSPHRPNFIGLSCVELKGIKGLQLFVINHDLLDGTPILDIKPYLNYADSFQCQRQGWLEDLPTDECLNLQWSVLAQKQITYLTDQGENELEKGIEMRLRTSPRPYANNRVKLLLNGSYELAYKTWRIYYVIQEQTLTILNLASGYDQATLLGEKLIRSILSVMVKPIGMPDSFVKVKWISLLMTQGVGKLSN